MHAYHADFAALDEETHGFRLENQNVAAVVASRYRRVDTASHVVSLFDENVERIPSNDRPDLVGITVKVDTAPGAFEIAARYRRRGVPVVLGGIPATACPEECLAQADAVVIGEAEPVWERLVEDAERRRLDRYYRGEGTFDIARSPVPRWDLLRSDRYMFTDTLTISRGCPWRCDFCYSSAPNFRTRYRVKSVGQIAAEIRSLETDRVMFIDDNTAHVVFRPRRMSAAELYRGYRRIYREFYSWANIMRRMPRDRSQRLGYLEFNLLYRKYGAFAAAIGKALGMRWLATLARVLAYPTRRETTAPRMTAGCRRLSQVT